MRLLIASASLLACACSLLVRDDLDGIRCEDEGVVGPPACPVGSVCGNGRCLDCQTVEVCDDGVDNDCSGQVDEPCGPGAGGEAGDPPFRR